jgi:hypothetical protein
MEPPPVIPDGFKSHGSPLPVLKLLAGFALGIVVSFLVWRRSESFDHLTGALLAVLGGKLIVGILFVFVQGWRSFGAGILTSIALGSLIFVYGLCGALTKL